MPKGVPCRKYPTEFKQQVIETMRAEGLNYSEASRRFGITSHTLLQNWERIYLAEGPEGFRIERRGHSVQGQPMRRVKPDREKELLAEVQRLRAENTYLKNCRPWFWKTSDASAKSAGNPGTEADIPAEGTAVRRSAPQSYVLLPAQAAEGAGQVRRGERSNPKDHTEHKGRYGYRRVTTELQARGLHHNYKLVSRLMKELKITCKLRVKKYRSYREEVGRIAPNLLERNFEAARPNEKMVTDVTEFKLFGQKVYLSVLLDLHSRDIVSYTISDRPVLSMVTSMLEKAFQIIPEGAELIIHSDQGWQYQHKGYRKILQERGIRQSMSIKGNCLDNAVIENFFGILKSELFYLQKFDSMEHFKTELIAYLDYYNNYRGKLSLSPACV